MSRLVHRIRYDIFGGTLRQMGSYLVNEKVSLVINNELHYVFCVIIMKINSEILRSIFILIFSLLGEP